jgi:predicted metal-dependent phosphoesterase TrpH
MSPASATLYTVKAELHCHTNRRLRVFYFPLFYESVQSESELLSACLEKHISVLAITDHDSLDGYRKAKAIITHRKLPILLIPACEIASRHGHILAYGIKTEIPRGLSAVETVRRIHAQGGLAFAAHPYNVALAVRDQVFTAGFDGAETHNSLIPEKYNFLAQTQLKHSPLIQIAGSDAHLLENIGMATVLFPQHTKTLTQVMTHLRTGNFRISYRSTPILRFVFMQIVSNLRYFLHSWHLGQK